jgi:glycerol-3-phosphate dehydrogenase subunit C
MSGVIPQDTCLGCSSCLLACPVAATDGRFAGPKTLGPAFTRRLDGGWPGEPPAGPTEAVALRADLCLQCHACDLACPSGVKVSGLVRRTRNLALAHPTGTFRRSAERLLAEQERLGHLLLVSRGARRLGRRLGRRPTIAIERLGLHILGLSPSRSLPDPPQFALAHWLRITRQPELERTRPTVILFAGCHARFLDPPAAQAAATVLRASGYRVVLPGQTCCGAPASSSGNEAIAIRAARANLTLLSQAFSKFGEHTPVVSPCPSCALTLRQRYPALLPSENSRQLASRVWDLGEFLAGPARRALRQALTQTRETAGPLSSEPEDTALQACVYHSPCHLRALGVGRPFQALLRDEARAKLLDPGPAADGCCGMGGLTGLSQSGHGRSLDTGALLLRTLKALDPALVLSDCPMCRWQIAQVTGQATAHPVEVLAATLLGPAVRP